MLKWHGRDYSSVSLKSSRKRKGIVNVLWSCDGIIRFILASKVMTHADFDDDGFRFWELVYHRATTAGGRREDYIKI